MNNWLLVVLVVAVAATLDNQEIVVLLEQIAVPTVAKANLEARLAVKLNKHTGTVVRTDVPFSEGGYGKARHCRAFLI